MIDEINNFKKKTDKFKSKTNRLSIKLKDNYEYLKKILDEKNNLEKLLKAETAQLKQVRPLILSFRNLNLFLCVLTMITNMHRKSILWKKQA